MPLPFKFTFLFFVVCYLLKFPFFNVYNENFLFEFRTCVLFTNTAKIYCIFFFGYYNSRNVLTVRFMFYSFCYTNAKALEYIC